MDNDTLWRLQDNYEMAAHILYCTSASLSLLANLILLYFVIFRSPAYLSPYKYCIGNSAISDTILSLACVFLQCRLIPNRWAFAFVAMGPAGLLGTEVSFHSYVLILHSLFYIFLCFPLSFAYRYYILRRGAPRASTILQLIGALYIIPILQLILFVYSQSDPVRIREYLMENKPQYFPYLDSYTITGAHMLWNWGTSVILATIILPMFPIYGLVVFFYRKTAKLLDSTDAAVRIGDRAKRTHRKLIKALMIQAALPFLFVFPPIILYCLYHVEVVQFTFIEYAVFVLFSFLPASNPYISLYFIRPYRSILIKWAGIMCNRRRPDAIKQSVSTVRNSSLTNKL